MRAPTPRQGHIDRARKWIDESGHDECNNVPGDDTDVNWLAREFAEVEAEALAWDEDDRALPEDEAIHDAHPIRTGRHDQYAEAMRLVGAKRSKGALVSLVTWLLFRLDPVTKGEPRKFRGDR